MAFVREMEASEFGFSRKMWKQMAELGWLGIDLPADVGGLEMGTLDLVILMRELGRHICPSPFLSTAVIAGSAIARAGSEEQRRRLIPQIVDGETIVAFAYQEFSRSFDPGVIKVNARASGDGYVLNGTKMFVEYAAAADLLLLVARTSEAPPSRTGLTMFLVDAKADGVRFTKTPTMARDHHYEVEFSDVQIPGDSVLGKVGDAWSDLEPVLEKGVVAFSAFTNGAAFRPVHGPDRGIYGRRIRFCRRFRPFHDAHADPCVQRVEQHGYELCSNHRE